MKYSIRFKDIFVKSDGKYYEKTHQLLNDKKYLIKYLKIKHSRYARCQWAHNNQVGMCPRAERFAIVPRKYDLY